MLCEHLAKVLLVVHHFHSSSQLPGGHIVHARLVCLMKYSKTNTYLGMASKHNLKSID